MGVESKKNNAFTEQVNSSNSIKNDKVFRNIFENTSIGLAMVDSQGLFLHLNSAFCSILGYSKETLLNKSYFHLLHNESLEDANACHKLMVDGGIDLIQFEKKDVRGDGSKLWLQISSIGVRDKNGNLEYSIVQIQNITDQREMEQLIKNSESKWRTIAESSPDHIMLLKNDLEIMYINRPLSQNYKDKMLGSCLLSYIPQEYHERVITFCRQVLKDGKSRQFESKYIIDGNDLGDYESRIGLAGKGEKMASLIVSIRDVTHRNKTEEKLKETNSQLKTLIDAIPDLVYFKDRNFRHLVVNRAFESFLGLEKGEAIGKTNKEILPSFLLTYCQNKDEKIFKTGRPIIHDEHSVASDDGREVYLDTTKIPLYGEDGKVEGLVGITCDITKRKEAEADLIRSKERCSLVIEGVSDGIWDRNLINGEIYFSPRWKEMLGYNDNEIPNCYEEWEKRVHPDDYKHVIKDINDHFKGKTPFYSSEFRLRHKDGSYRWILGRGATIKNSKGRPTRFAGSHTDITEKKYMEEELLKAKRIESIGLLAGGIAHDFNNILTGVLTNIQVARDCFSDFDNCEQDISKSLGYAESATMRATELTKQLLTFSKGGAPTIKPASVADLITETVSFILRGSNLRRRCIIPKDLWDARIDTGQISQVLNNLLINARHSMPSGGTVTIKAENEFIADNSPMPVESGNYIKLTIKDRGAGISAENIDRIFDPYFTTKGEGSGLGLATSYIIIKKHKGHIYVESELGKGTSFYIYLPANSEKISRKNRAKDIDSHAGTGRVLLLEDELIVADSVKTVVIRAGYDLQHVEDGKEAIKLYKKARKSGDDFDVVMMDLTIAGGMGGVETLKRLKKIDPLVKAIVCSGYSDGDVIADYKKYGFCDVLPKPFSKDQVLATLNSVIKK